MNGTISGAARHRNRIPAACSTLLITACLLACGSNSAVEAETARTQPTVAPVVVIDATAVPEKTQAGGKSSTATPTASEAAATPEETPAPTPNISVTTGHTLPVERKFQPVLAVIGNAPQVRPQTGLMEADIIYEFSLDRNDHATRLLALFSDRDPARVGPIQDARSYFFDLRREWNATLVYNGYPAETEYPVYDPGTIDFPGEYDADSAQHFTQDKTVSSAPENTLFCKLTELRGALFGTTGVPASNARFAFQTGVLHKNANRIIKVGVAFTSSDFSSAEFVYNSSDNMFHRYERNSKGTLVLSKTLTTSVDGTSVASEPLRVQNLIVQYVRYDNLFGPYHSAALISKGECDYFVNGRHSAGRWSRASLGEPTVYTMRDGSPLVLEPGTTWIVLHTTQRAVKIQYDI